MPKEIDAEMTGMFYQDPAKFLWTKHGEPTRTESAPLPVGK